MLRLSAVCVFCIAVAVPAMAQTRDEVDRRISARECQGLAAIVSPRAQSGDEIAQRQLGELYYNGCGAPEDAALAVRWFGLAARQADAQAQEALGIMTQKGEGGLRKSNAEALTFYRSAALQGSAFSQNKVGWLLNNAWPGNVPNGTEAARWFNMAAAQGDTNAMFNLGDLYDYGASDFAKDPVAAAEWYQRASNLGLADATARLARFYALGLGGLPEDVNRAIDLYGKAAEAGNSEAQVGLGYIYDAGMGDRSRDPDKAAYWYGRAVEGGNPFAQYNLGRMKWDGDGVGVDRVGAFELYRKAADQGIPAAINALGVAYGHGEGGVPLDLSRAMKLFKQAAAAGDETAQINVRELATYNRLRASARRARSAAGGPTTSGWRSTTPSYSQQFMMNANGGPGSKCYAGSAFNQGCR